MNIFYVAECPVAAAQALVDRHVVKMVLESAQMLSTAHRVLDGKELVILPDLNVYSDKPRRKFRHWELYDQRESILYKATHVNHPCNKWIRENVENYNWLVEHFFALMDEYTFRYDKKHKCFGELSYQLSSPPKNLEYADFTLPPSCMDEQYIISDKVLDNYRNYYIIGKSSLHSWKRRDPPTWIYTEVE